MLAVALLTGLLILASRVPVKIVLVRLETDAADPCFCLSPESSDGTRGESLVGLGPFDGYRGRFPDRHSDDRPSGVS
jgi:hypothetical protein